MRGLSLNLGLNTPRRASLPASSPDPFALIDQSAVPQGISVYSNAITVSGLGSGNSAVASVSGANARQRVNGGRWTSDDQSVADGDTLQVTTLSSASNNSAVTATLDIGGASESWSVTTHTSRKIYFGKKTRRGHGGFNLGSALTITGGDASGRWTVDASNKLVPAGTLGSAPPAWNAGYSLAFSDGSTLEIEMLDNAAHFTGGFPGESGTTFQLRVLLGVASGGAGHITRGDTLIQRDGGDINLVSSDLRIRTPIGFHDGAGRIVIRPETPLGAKIGRISFDPATSGAGSVPYDWEDTYFCGTNNAGITITATMLGFSSLAASWSDLRTYNCKFEIAAGSTDLLSGLTSVTGSVILGCEFENLYDGVVNSNPATNCVMEWNDFHRIANDAVKGKFVNIEFNDNLVYDKVYLSALVHGDFFQDQGVLSGDASPRSFGNARRNIFVRGEGTPTWADGQGLFLADTPSGNLLTNVVAENNIYIGTFQQGILISRSTDPVCRSNTVIYDVEAGAVTSNGSDFQVADAMIRISGATGGTSTHNAANAFDTPQVNTNSNNKTLGRNPAAYDAAFAEPAFGSVLHTRQGVIDRFKPLENGTLKNPDGTYAGALLPDGRWNDQSVF